MNLFDNHEPQDKPIPPRQPSDGYSAMDKLKAQLTHNPGSTAPEYAAMICASADWVARRLDDLETIGQAKRGLVRFCRVTRTDLPTWR